MANTFTQQAEEAGVLKEGRFGGINRENVVNFLKQVDDIYAQEIGKRSQEIAERDNKNAEANRAIQEKDDQIANLQATSQEKDGQIADLQATSQEKDDQIADLQEKVAAYEENQKVTEGITTSINEASATIQDLRDENKTLRERLERAEGTDPAAETAAQRKTIAALRNALAKAEESSDVALKARIAELEKTVQAQKKAVEGGDLWSSLGDVASAVETRAKERADARDRQSRTRAKAIVSHAQFTALEVIGKASKQYDAMMTAGGAQVDVTNDTLHEGYTEYIKYFAGLNGVVEDTIHNLEDTLDNATKKMAEAMVAIKSLREVRKPLVKAMEDVFKPVELSGIKTADKLPGMDDVLAFIASAPGVGISEDNLTEKDVKETIGKVDDTYTDMQVNIANAQLKAGVPEEPKEEVTEEEAPEEATEEEAPEVAIESEDAPEVIKDATLTEEVEEVKETEEVEEAEEAKETEEVEVEKAEEPEVEKAEEPEVEKAEEPEVEEPEEVQPLIPDDATTVIPVVVKEEN